MEKFITQWHYYYNLRRETIDPNPEYAKMLLIECLPKEEADRAMQLVITNGISLENRIKKYNEKFFYSFTTLPSRRKVENFPPFGPEVESNRFVVVGVDANGKRRCYFVSRPNYTTF